MEKKGLSYNEAFVQLQEIVNLIEEGQLDIDDLSSKIKEASALLKVCKEKLFVASEETKKILEELK